MATTVKTLSRGDVLLVEAKGVRNGKIQLEFAEHITNPFAKSSNELVSLMNKSDERFSSKPRRAWMSGEKVDIESLLDIKLSELSEGDVKELNILNPVIKGQKVRVQITETTDPDDYQKDHIDEKAKRAGADGDFIFNDGKHIFSNPTAVLGEPNHTFLVGDEQEDTGSTEEAYEAPEELTA